MSAIGLKVYKGLGAAKGYWRQATRAAQEESSLGLQAGGGPRPEDRLRVARGLVHNRQTANSFSEALSAARSPRSGITRAISTGKDSRSSRYTRAVSPSGIVHCGKNAVRQCQNSHVSSWAHRTGACKSKKKTRRRPNAMVMYNQQPRREGAWWGLE